MCTPWKLRHRQMLCHGRLQPPQQSHGHAETEGTDILRFKFAFSSGNMSGKQLVPAESATWLNEYFLSSWGDVKKAINLYFLGGLIMCITECKKWAV
jgi:hypothetical protein